MTTITANREVPKPCSATLTPRQSSLAKHPLLHIVSTSPARPCRLLFFLSPRISRVGRRPPPIADPANFFRAAPCLHSDALSRPKFFLSPATEIPWKVLSSGTLFFSAEKTHLCKNTPLPRTTFPSGKESFCRPGGRRIIFWPRCFHSDTQSPPIFFLSPNAYLPSRTFSSGNSFLRPIADPVIFFRAVPCSHSDTLSGPRFFPSPAWEIPLKIFRRGRKVSGGLFSGPDVFTPIHSRLRFFF